MQRPCRVRRVEGVNVFDRMMMDRRGQDERWLPLAETALWVCGTIVVDEVAGWLWAGSGI